MITQEEFNVLSMCVEGFLYGKISVLCAKEVQLFPGLGIYSGIFAIYFKLQFASKDSRTTTIIFYALCLLYVLSTATVISDLLISIIDSDVSNKFYYL